MSVAGSRFKLRDTHLAPQGFSLAGQSFDTITLQWDNNHSDGYVVQVTDKATNRHDLQTDRNNTKYILVLTSGTNLDGLFLYSELFGGQKRVNDLVDNGSIHSIAYYDSTDESIGLTLTDLPREWQYLSIAKLSRRNINRNGLLLEKSSPWSHQEVGGIQVA